MKSTLIELPPDSQGLDEDSIDFIRASSVEELARRTSINSQAVLNRVLLPGKRFGSYHILGFVAAGGMGEIYAAQRLKDDGSRSRPVALKVITAEFANDWRIIERFKREARISRAIRSKHVVRVYEFGESPDGHAFLSMELLTGEELFDRLHRNKALPTEELAHLALQILKGLHQIHLSGFVHRDIKPENIFLARAEDGSEAVKILDFGIAKRADQKSDPLLSVVGQIYGTPQYLAPEQAINPDVDHRADLYSLGVVLYECVTGSLPFDGDSSYALILAHQNQAPPPLPSSVDPEFAAIITRALAKDPDKRFQTALEMGQTIKRWLDDNQWSRRHAPPQDPAPIIDTSMDDLLSTSPRSPNTDEMIPPAISPPRPHQNTPRPAAVAAQPSAAAPDSADLIIAPPPEDSTELRSPNAAAPLSAADAQKAQIVTGIALGLIILAIGWALLTWS
ncbi:hypothetical protein DL240_07295 [Lujinxingia litoralis]|uniref:non-specific serine/threonine protein kinase n=1 Tax=Lujinxingia litoralis TaxID=2211119 RepID=A0A328C7M4_9DELT|nr:serine/threonine-protein kinase [Lujinxingia litoralis]RAL23945.1 hypothetical protein DL240_07295 [Lujinxingia litoralis]